MSSKYITADFFDSVPVFDELFASWWAFHYPEAKAFDKRLLGRYGAIAKFAGRPCALQYIYLIEDSDMAWIGFTTRHPDLKAYSAGKAIKALLQTNEEALKKMGKTLVYTNFASPALHKAVRGMGYVGGVESKEYMKVLGV